MANKQFAVCDTCRDHSETPDGKKSPPATWIELGVPKAFTNMIEADDPPALRKAHTYVFCSEKCKTDWLISFTERVG